MNNPFPTADADTGYDRLGFAIFFALALHSMVIFGIGFGFLKPQPATTALEVTLAQHATDDIVEDADYLAQANQVGSGESTENKKITTDELSAYTADVLRDTQPVQPAAVAMSQQQETQRAIATSQRSDTKTTLHTEDGARDRDAQQTQVVPEPVTEISSLRAQLDLQKQAFNKMPNVLRLTSASTKASEHAAYLKYWVDRVEQTGNLHYPAEARRKKLYGDLRLAVTILPDGSVESIEVLKPSPYPLLDRAAVETVRLAAPFARFPKQMARWDKLEIIQTWRFLPGNKIRTQ